MTSIDWDDVQGIVRSGLGWLKHASYVLLEVTEHAKARAWLSTLALTSAAHVQDRDTVPLGLNIAFTFDGLCALGFDPQDPAGFSREFREGIAPLPGKGQAQARRSGMLGDVGANDPLYWSWGGQMSDSPPVHILLMAFGDEEVSKQAAELIAPQSETGVRPVLTLSGWLPADKREHFGFRDGLSQPVIDPESERIATDDQRRLHLMAAGEFLIGYPNERGNMPLSPKAPHNPDFGRNGTYLVLRELHQDVAEFEAWLDAQSYDVPNANPEDRRTWFAAKLIGRWPNGAPLTRFPQNDRTSDIYGTFNTADPATANDFFYRAEDPDGFRCPLGSHIRRSWPRDSLGTSAGRGLTQSRLHRILRRGRLFGPAYDRENPSAATNAKARGLIFMCLNTDIAGQFEAVQHNWINNSEFSGLSGERDPLLGERDAGAHMTIQQSPANLRVRELKQFVTTRGGGYFFLPGIKALQSFANLSSSHGPVSGAAPADWH